MAYTSLRTRYPPVREIPQRLADVCSRMKDGNAKFLLARLLRSPEETLLGYYDWRGGTVQLMAPLRWRTLVGEELRTIVPYSELGIAVIALRVVLRYHGFSFGVWRWCETGQGYGSGRRRGGYRYHNPPVPFKIGLVERGDLKGQTALPRAG